MSGQPPSSGGFIAPANGRIVQTLPQRHKRIFRLSTGGLDLVQVPDLARTTGAMLWSSPPHLAEMCRSAL